MSENTPKIDRNIDLLEESGYSYSGISDIIHNKEQAPQLIQQMDAKYRETSEKEHLLLKQMEELNEKLSKVKNLKSRIESSFYYAQKAMKLDKHHEDLCYEIEEGFALVKTQKKSDGRIEFSYQKYLLTDLTRTDYHLM